MQLDRRRLVQLGRKPSIAAGLCAWPPQVNARNNSYDPEWCTLHGKPFQLTQAPAARPSIRHKLSRLIPQGRPGWRCPADVPVGIETVKKAESAGWTFRKRWLNAHCKSGVKLQVQHQCIAWKFDSAGRNPTRFHLWPADANAPSLGLSVDRLTVSMQNLQSLR